MNDQQVVKLIARIKEQFEIDSNLETIEQVRKIISETEEEIKNNEDLNEDSTEETEKLNLLKDLLNLYLNPPVTCTETNDADYNVPLAQLKEEEKKIREEITTLLENLKLAHNIKIESLSEEKEKIEKLHTTLSKRKNVEQEKLNDLKKKLKMMESAIQNFGLLKKKQMIIKKKTIDGIKNKKIKDLVLELDAEYNKIDCIDLKVFDEDTLNERIIQIYEEINNSEKQDVKKIKQLNYLQGLSEKVKRIKELEIYDQEKEALLKFIKKISADNDFIDNVHISSNLFAKLESQHIININQLTKKKEIEKENKFLSDSFKEIKRLDNYSRNVEISYKVSLSKLEEKIGIGMARKIEENDILEYFTNKEEYLSGINYLETFLKLVKFFDKDETLHNLEEDIKANPEGSVEKNILKLVYDLKLSLETNGSNIEKRLDEIHLQLKEQSLESYETKDTMANIRNFINSEKFIDAAANLLFLLKLITPINVFEIERLFNKTEEKAKLIKGKNVILPLGRTGAGKSTTICYLAFCKMKQDNNKHIDIDPEIKSNINCKVSWRTKSETRYINPILINVLGKIPNCKDKEIIVCDTPGFLDTEGVEIDISNGLGVIHAIKGCKGVKPVLVFSKTNTGARFELLENTFQMIIGIIDKGFEYQLPALDYLFTGFEKSELPMIKTKITDLKENKQNSKIKTDQLCTKILEDLLEKLTEDKIINPLDGHPEKLLQIWMKDSKYIENCDETFKFIINSEPKNTVLLYCNAIKRSVMIHIQKFKNFEIVDFKLSQLRTLKKIVQIKEIDEFYEAIIQEVCDYLNGFYKNECDKFNKGAQIGNKFSDQDIKTYKEMIDLVRSTENLKINHLGDKVYYIEYFEKNIISNIEFLLRIIGLNTTPEKEMLNAVRKIYHLSDQFKEFDSVYSKTQGTKTEIEKKIAEALEDFEKNIEEIKNDPAANKLRNYLLICLNSLNYVKSISENLEEFIPGISEKNEKFKIILQEFFKTINERTYYEESDIKEAKEFIEKRYKSIKLMETACSLPFDKYIDSSLLKEFHQEMLNQLEEDCKTILKLIQDELDPDGSQDIILLKKNYDILNEYKKKFSEPKYKEYIEPSIKEASEFLKSSFNKIVNEVNSIINNFQGQDEKTKINSFSLRKLGKGLSLLNNKEHQDWLKSFIGVGFVRQAISGITNRVSNYLYEMRDQFVQMELDVSNHNKLTNAIELMDSVMQAREFESLGEDFKQIFYDIRNYFEVSVDKVLNIHSDKSKEYKILDEIELTNELLNYLSYFNDVYRIKSALKRFSLKKDYVMEANERIKCIQHYLKEKLCDMDKNLEFQFKKLKSIDLKSQTEAETACIFIIDSLKKLKKINSLNKVIHLLNRNFKEIIKDYEHFFNEFSENSELFTNNPEKFQIILNICKRLSKIDSEFKEFGQSKSFDDLFKQKLEYFKNQNTDVEQIAINKWIPNYEFQELKQYFEGSKKNPTSDMTMNNFLKNQEKNIRDSLNKKLDEIRNEIKKSFEYFEAKINTKDFKGFIRELNQNMSILSDVEQVIPQEYLTFKKNNDKYEKLKIEFISTFETAVAKLENIIKNQFQKNHFEKAEELYFNLLENFKIKNVYYEEKKVEEFQKRISEYREKALKIVIEEVKKLAFQVWEYSNVIDLYPSIETMSQNSDPDINEIYSSYKKDFFESLKVKITEKVSIIYKNEKNEMEINNLMEVKKKFPESLQKYFDYHYYNAEQMEKKAKYIEESLSKAEEKLKNNQFEDFTKIFEGIKFEEFPDLKKEFIKKAQNAQDNMIQNFESVLSAKNFDNLAIESEKINSFIKSMNKVASGSIENDITKNVNEVYKKNVQNIMDNFPKILESDSINIGNVDLISKDFNYINNIMENHQKFRIFKSFQNDYETTFKKMINIISTENDCLIDYIEKRLMKNSEKLRKIIKKRKAIENFISDILSPKTFNLILNNCPNLNLPKDLPQKIIINQNDLLGFLNNKMEEIIKKNFAQLDLSEKERKESRIRKQEYEETANTLLFVKSFEDFKEFKEEFGNGYTKSQDMIKTKIDDHFKLIENKYLSRKPEEVYNERECIDINAKLDNFNIMAKEFCFAEQKCLESHKNIKENLIDQILKVKEMALNSDDTGIITKALIKAQVYKTYIPEIIEPEKAADIQTEIIMEFKKKAGENSYEALNNLGNQILLDPAGQIVVSEHKLFKNLKISLFNDKIKKFGVEIILNGNENEDLKGMTGDGIDKEKILKRFQEFDQYYKELITKYLKPKDPNKPKDQSGIKLDPIKQNLDLILEGISKEKNKKGFFDSLKKWFDDAPKFEIPKILACVFAIWTLQNAEDFFELSNQQNDDTSKGKFLLQPHPAQVLSILRMFSCGDKDEKIKNGLVQIGTGEGKSVTLAITATILVLFGYSVECVCYSTYLSSRDFEDFKEYFRYMGVLDYIEYGPFSFLCEKCINSDINLRESTLEFYGINIGKTNSKSKTEIREKILLFDEVDVFFSKDFYGASYNPTSFFKHPHIYSLFKMIWDTKKLTYSNALNSNEFKNCLKEFPKMESLLKEALKDIIAASKAQIEKNYEVLNDRIAYKEQDSISFDISYGYTTTFTYFLEKDQGNISQQSLEDNCGVQIKLGSFSYAEIPKSSYKYIMGVTGTLETLGNEQKIALKKNYKFEKETFMPSVYGKNNREFDKMNNVFIEDQLSYFDRIKTELEKNLDNGKRSVLIFFKDEKRLQEFYDSDDFQNLKPDARILTEKASNQEKNAFISTATFPNGIALMTRCFGRGSDFKVRYESVRKAGGVHVIQTFLSEDKSEEIQIQGRCARQGDKGTYSMVLLLPELEMFGITKSNLPENKTERYNFLDKKRKSYFDNESKKNETHLEQTKIVHEEAMKFKQNLQNNAVKEVESYLLKRNKGVEFETKVRSRTLCLMDATGSMGNLLDCAKKTIKIVFERAKETMEKEGLNPDCFEVSIAFYRNYSSLEKEILEASQWVKKPDDLETFMKSNDIDGGQGNEAIEIGLNHAKNEYDKNPDIPLQIILIGDAAANTLEDVTRKRAGVHVSKWFGFSSLQGEEYWKKTKYGTPTYYKTELNELKKRGVKIHPFYVDRNAEQCFKQLATEPGGGFFLDINNSAKGEGDLLNTLVQIILRGVGGDKLQDSFCKAYKCEKLYK